MIAITLVDGIGDSIELLTNSVASVNSSFTILEIISVSNGKTYVNNPNHSSIAGMGFSVGGTTTLAILQNLAANNSLTLTTKTVQNSSQKPQQAYTPFVCNDQYAPDCENGVAYSYQCVASGGSGNYNFSYGSVHPFTGLTMSPTGLITGIPNYSLCEPAGQADEDISFHVNDGAGGVGPHTGEFYLNIRCWASLKVTTSSLPNGTNGTPYDQHIVAEGGTIVLGNLILSNVGALPPGLSLLIDNAWGYPKLIGTPTSSGAYTISGTLTDSLGASVSFSIPLTIS